MQVKRMVTAGLLSFTVLFTALAPANCGAATSYDRCWSSHGTDRTKQITKEMIKSDPPEDYVIPEGLVRDAKDGAYSGYFTKDGIQTVRVRMDENNLNYMLQHAGEKAQVMAESVTIGDTSAGYVGIKAKGNYTLKTVYESSDSDKFSFTLNFGKYIKKKKYGKTQNFYGVSKICLNNLFFDTTAVKEYTALRLMTEMGVPTPEYGLARLYINDRFYGVCSMIEAMDSAILERTQNVEKKAVSDYLVKPEYTTLRYASVMDQYADAAGNFSADSLTPILYRDESSNNYVFKDPGFSAADKKNIVNLWENDEDTLQDVAPALPGVFTWQKKLNLLSQGKDFSGKAIDVNSAAYVQLLGQVLDVDEALRYFAAHSFLVQTDDMFNDYTDPTTKDHQKNFVLYVGGDGVAKVLPWDYDLSWGNFRGCASAEEMANYPVDNMTYDSGKELGSFYKDYPLFHVIYQNDSLMEKYHTYMADCAKLVALGGVTSDGQRAEPGAFTAVIDGVKEQIIDAMGEQLAPNVYYNQNGQPNAAKRGITSLRKAVSMRALGVWLALGQQSDYRACGVGCSLAALGNGSTRGGSYSGKLGLINPETAIVVLGDFDGDSGRMYLSGGRLSAGAEAFDLVAKRLKGTYEVYGFDQVRKAKDGYDLYIPIPTDKKNIQFYSYAADADELTALAADADADGRYRVHTDSVDCIVVAEGAAVLPSSRKTTAAKQTVITATDFCRSASTKKQSFSLGAKTNYGTMSYTSSKKKVKVSADGRVTLPAKFTGTVKITIAVKAADGYTAAQKTIKLFVPGTVKLKSVRKSSGNYVKAIWKKVSGAEGYSVQYSTSKKFAKKTTVTVKKGSSKSAVLKKMKTGKTYYVRVKSYVKSGAKKYSGMWSTLKSVKL